MSTLKTNTIGNVAGTASTDILNVVNGSAKAWVHFNGTGTVTILASYNVFSITDNGVGSYTINFTNAFPDTAYVVTIGAGVNAGSPNYVTAPCFESASAPYGYTTTSCGYRLTAVNGGSSDARINGLAFFR